MHMCFHGWRRCGAEVALPSEQISETVKERGEERRVRRLICFYNYSGDGLQSASVFTPVIGALLLPMQLEGGGLQGRHKGIHRKKGGW